MIWKSDWESAKKHLTVVLDSAEVAQDLQLMKTQSSAEEVTIVLEKPKKLGIEFSDLAEKCCSVACKVGIKDVLPHAPQVSELTVTIQKPVKFGLNFSELTKDYQCQKYKIAVKEVMSYAPQEVKDQIQKYDRLLSLNGAQAPDLKTVVDTITSLEEGAQCVFKLLRCPNSQNWGYSQSELFETTIAEAESNRENDLYIREEGESEGSGENDERSESSKDEEAQTQEGQQTQKTDKAADDKSKEQTQSADCDDKAAKDNLKTKPKESPMKLVLYSSEDDDWLLENPGLQKTGKSLKRQAENSKFGAKQMVTTNGDVIAGEVCHSGERDFGQKEALIQRLTTEKQRMEQEIKGIKAENQSTQGMYTQLQKDHTELQQQLKVLQEKYAKFETDARDFKEKSKKESSKLKKDNKRLQQETQLYKKHFQDEHTKLQENHTKMQQKAQCLEAEYMDEIARLHEDNTKLQHEAQQLKERLKHESTQLQNNHSKLQEEIQKHNENKEGVHSAVTCLDKEAEHHKVGVQQMVATNDDVILITEDSPNMKSFAAQEKGLMQSLETTQQRMEGRIIGLTDENQINQDIHTQLQEDHEELQQNFNVLKEKYFKVHENAEKFKETSQNEYAKLQEDYKKLQRETQTFKKQCQDRCTKLEEDSTKMQKEAQRIKKEYQAEIARLQEDNNKVKHEAQQLKGKFQKDYTELKNNYSKLKQEVQKRNQNQEGLNQVLKENNDMKQFLKERNLEQAFQMHLLWEQSASTMLKINIPNQPTFPIEFETVNNKLMVKAIKEFASQDCKSSMQKGDILHNINNFKVNSIQMLQMACEMLASVPTLSLDIERPILSSKNGHKKRARQSEETIRLVVQIKNQQPMSIIVPTDQDKAEIQGFGEDATEEIASALRIGDVLCSVNGLKVNNPEDFKIACEMSCNMDILTLCIERKQGTLHDKKHCKRARQHQEKIYMKCEIVIKNQQPLGIAVATENGKLIIKGFTDEATLEMRSKFNIGDTIDEISGLKINSQPILEIAMEMLSNQESLTFRIERRMELDCDVSSQAQSSAHLLCDEQIDYSGPS
mmetsp:Transcript_16758/g.22143  ORF Transcript_16758/g.22143 Transcript_16758/m.22143 type:complete len:1062 (-) Transcript_16758:57-3242(-)